MVWLAIVVLAISNASMCVAMWRGLKIHENNLGLINDNFTLIKFTIDSLGSLRFRVALLEEKLPVSKVTT